MTCDNILYCLMLYFHMVILSFSSLFLSWFQVLQLYFYPVTIFSSITFSFDSDFMSIIALCIGIKVGSISVQ